MLSLHLVLEILHQRLFCPARLLQDRPLELEEVREEFVEAGPVMVVVSAAVYREAVALGS